MYASSSLDGSLVTLRRKEKVEIGSKKVFIFKIPVLPLENYISLKKYYLTENKEKDEK